MLINDPQVPDSADASKLDSTLFNGRAMTYDGRWTYKFEEGARQGRGRHSHRPRDRSRRYPFSVVQGNLRERFDLVAPDKNMGRAAIEGWLSLDAATRALRAGRSRISMRSRNRHSLVISVLCRSDSGHRSASAIPCERPIEKRAWRGSRAATPNCATNTSSTRPTGITSEGQRSERRRHLQRRTRQCIGCGDGARNRARLHHVRASPEAIDLFLMVGAEEQGLLGSQHYAEQPIYPLAKTLANINIDGAESVGPNEGHHGDRAGRLRPRRLPADAAAEQGRTLRPDPESEKGFYYRSDHFNFAKHGVPALYTDTGIDFVGKPPEYSQQKRDEYTNNDYHAPSDEIKDDWDLTGALDDAQLLFMVGYRLPVPTRSRSGSLETNSRPRGTRC